MTGLLAFSTLACPEWPAETVIANAAAYGYEGIEWRGGAQGHVPPSLPPARRAALRRAASEAGLFALAVTAYTSFVAEDPVERQKNVDALKRSADLAADLDAQYVRAFIGEVDAPADLPALYDRIAHCLEAAAQHAGSVGVTIAVEPHDDFVRSSAVAPILERLSHPALGVIWDIGNAFSAGEQPEEGFQLLGKRLTYVQVKDGVGRGPTWRLTRLGEGEVPLGRAFGLLQADGYGGAFSVEWERAWHPELDPPEIALPAALRTLRNLLANAQAES